MTFTHRRHSSSSHSRLSVLLLGTRRSSSSFCHGCCRLAFRADRISTISRRQGSDGCTIVQFLRGQRDRDLVMEGNSAARCLAHRTCYRRHYSSTDNPLSPAEFALECKIRNTPHANRICGGTGWADIVRSDYKAKVSEKGCRLAEGQSLMKSKIAA